MADLTVNFLHPTDGRQITVVVDSAMTAREAIAELITNDFIPATSDGYNLAVKGGNQIQANGTFGGSGVKDNDIIRVIPMTDAGFNHVK